MTISVVAIGAAIAFYGIVSGNLAVGSMVNEAKAEVKSKREIFSSIEEMEPDAPNTQRSNAISRYKDQHPDGLLTKRLRMGQLLTVAGCFISLFGMFI